MFTVLFLLPDVALCSGWHCEREQFSEQPAITHWNSTVLNVISLFVSMWCRYARLRFLGVVCILWYCILISVTEQVSVICWERRICFTIYLLAYLHIYLVLKSPSVLWYCGGAPDWWKHHTSNKKCFTSNLQRSVSTWPGQSLSSVVVLC